MEKAADSDGKKAGLRILVVDDNADCADSTGWLLRAWGHEVEIARDGPGGLAAAQGHLPDVILLDIGLPGLNGWQFSRRLKDGGCWKKPLIIAVTGYGQMEDRRHSAESGIDLHLVKPVDPRELEMVLRKYQELVAD